MVLANWSKWKRDNDTDSLVTAAECLEKMLENTSTRAAWQQGHIETLLRLEGWFGEPLCPPCQLQVWQGSLSLELNLSRHYRADVELAFGLTKPQKCGFVAELRLPNDIDNLKLKVTAETSDGYQLPIAVPTNQKFITTCDTVESGSLAGYVDSASLVPIQPPLRSSPMLHMSRQNTVAMLEILITIGELEYAQEWYRALRPVVLNSMYPMDAIKVALALGNQLDALSIAQQHSSANKTVDIVAIHRPCGSEIISIPPSAHDHVPSSTHNGYLRSDTYPVLTVPDACVYSGGIVVSRRQMVVHEAASEPCTEFTAGHSDKVVATPYRRDRAVLMLPSITTEPIEQAILVTSRCAENYFHSLIEHAPRLLTIQKHHELHGLPLLIDEATPPTVAQAIRYLCPSAEHLTVPSAGGTRVTNLAIPLLHSYVPDSTLIPFSKICLSDEHLMFLRNGLLPHMSGTEWPRRIFIGRATGGRNLFNGLDILTVLETAGFVIVDTGALSLEDQINLFANATDIVGVAGSGFSNTIFCNSEARITALYAGHNLNYPLQRMLAAASGASFSAFYGSTELDYGTTSQDVLHAPFSIDSKEFREHLRRFHG